jgi:hypothetical protein
VSCMDQSPSGYHALCVVGALGALGVYVDGTSPRMREADGFA